jgi:mono/diheme cytochrome c family protein
MTTRTLWAILLAACAVSSEAALTQTRTPPLPSISIDSLAGRDSFDLYCASCHGTGGGGNGPVATELRTRPADLTALAQRNNGAFPRDQVRAVVAGQGRALSAHGTTEMPVWGPMFRMFESDARVRERIENLVTHLESLQRPTTRAGDPGAQVFRTYCASCHGTTARGNGPLADQLRHAPPDLTQFSTRNGGVFPSERLNSYHRWPRSRGTWRPYDASLGGRIPGRSRWSDPGSGERSNHCHREIPERDPGTTCGVAS